MKSDYNPLPIFAVIVKELEKAIINEDWNAVKEIHKQLKALL